jgi:hypothetical protein
VYVSFSDAKNRHVVTRPMSMPTPMDVSCSHSRRRRSECSAYVYVVTPKVKTRRSRHSSTAMNERYRVGCTSVSMEPPSTLAIDVSANGAIDDVR